MGHQTLRLIFMICVQAEHSIGSNMLYGTLAGALDTETGLQNHQTSIPYRTLRIIWAKIDKNSEHQWHSYMTELALSLS